MPAGLPGRRAYRDRLLPAGYESPQGLQARMCKQALTDAYETLAKFWAAVADEMRPLVFS